MNQRLQEVQGKGTSSKRSIRSLFGTLAAFGVVFGGFFLAAFLPFVFSPDGMSFLSFLAFPVGSAAPCLIVILMVYLCMPLVVAEDKQGWAMMAMFPALAMFGTTQIAAWVGSFFFLDEVSLLARLGHGALFGGLPGLICFGYLALVFWRSRGGR